MNAKSLRTFGTFAVVGGAVVFVAEQFMAQLKTPQLQQITKWVIVGGVALLLLGLAV